MSKVGALLRLLAAGSGLGPSLATDEHGGHLEPGQGERELASYGYHEVPQRMEDVRQGLVHVQRNSFPENNDFNLVTNSHSFPYYCWDVHTVDDYCSPCGYWPWERNVEKDNVSYPYFELCDEEAPNQRFRAVYDLGGEDFRVEVEGVGETFRLCLTKGRMMGVYLSPCSSSSSSAEDQTWSYDFETELVHSSSSDCLSVGKPDDKLWHPTDNDLDRDDTSRQYLKITSCNPADHRQRFFKRLDRVETVPPNRSTLNILLLGDSFSAGNGYLADDVGWDGGYENYPGCKRHSMNWGNQIADKFRAEGYRVVFTNKACSGAIAPDLFVTGSGQKIYQGLAQEVCNLDIKYSDVKSSVTSCNSQVVLKPQAEHVSSTHDIVYLSIGANDMNFGKIARVCLLGDPSDLINFNPWSTAWVPKCRDVLARSLLEMQLEFDEKTCDLDLPSSSCSNSARENLVKALRDIKSRMNPDGVIMLMVYPHLALDMREHSNDSTIIRMAEEIRDFVRKFRRQFLDMIDRINEEDPVGPQIYAYEGLMQSFEGKEASLSLPSKNYEHGWFHEISLSLSTIEQLTSYFRLINFFHPNSQGQHEMANSAFPFLKSTKLFENSGARRLDLVSEIDADIAIIVEVTDVMSGVVESIATLMPSISKVISDAMSNSRVALVSFSCDNQASVLQDFTANAELINAAALRLRDRVISCQGGSSFTSATYAAVHHLSWRLASSSWNSVQLIAASMPAEGFYSSDDLWHLLLSVNVDFNLFWSGYDEPPEDLLTLTRETGGQFFETVDDDTALKQVAEKVESLITMPRALIEVPSYGAIGKPIVVGGTNSFDPKASDIVKYRWFIVDEHLDEDNIVERYTQTATPVTELTFDNEFTGYIFLRVETDDGRISRPAVASLTVNERGAPLPPNCPLDVLGRPVASIDGIDLDCTVPVSQSRRPPSLAPTNVSPHTRAPTKKRGKSGKKERSKSSKSSKTKSAKNVFK